MAVRRRWDVQVARNWWLSVGFHFDHTDPSLTLHLPGFILSFGRLKQPGLRRLDASVDPEEGNE